MAKNFLLVDAHNVIFAHPELAALHQHQALLARERLIGLLERYQDSSGTRVVAVFDGGSHSKTTNQMSGPAGVQVFYPQRGQTADAIIERLVLKHAKTHHLTVATNDNLIRTAASAAEASVIDAETLFSEISAAEEKLSETLQRLRRQGPS